MRASIVADINNSPSQGSVKQITIESVPRSKDDDIVQILREGTLEDNEPFASEKNSESTLNKKLREQRERTSQLGGKEATQQTQLEGDKVLRQKMQRRKKPGMENRVVVFSIIP